MGKWRQKMAAALVVSMMMGTVSAGAAFAEETPKKGWKLEEGGWVHWRVNPDDMGNMMDKNRIKAIKEPRQNNKMIVYCFNEDGYMVNNETYDLETERLKNTLPGAIKEANGSGSASANYLDAEILSEDDPAFAEIDLAEAEKQTIYAYPDGPVAIDKWVVLDSKGHLAADPDEDGCGWYYFGPDGLMWRNREKTDETGEGTKTFRLGADGKMISSDFGAPVESKWDSNLTTRKYYNHMGESIVNKWQYIGREWYKFEEDGYYIVASDSNAEADFDENGHLKEGRKKPEPAIVSVEPSEENRKQEIAVNKTVELEFTIKLASDSNAEPPEKFGLGKHDRWKQVTFPGDDANLGVKSYETGKYQVKDGEDPLTKYVTFTYTPKIPCEAEVRFMIDEVPCEPYIVTASANSAAARGDAIKTMLEAQEGGAGLDSALSPERVKNNISTMFEGVEGEDRNDLKDTWRTQKSAVADLSYKYAMEKQVEERGAEVSDEAMELLGIGDATKIEVAGAGLNGTEEGQSVGLAVAEPEEKPDIDLGDKKAEERVDVDISFMAGNVGAEDAAEISELEIPVIVTMPLPNAFDGKSVTVYHTSDGGETEKLTSGSVRDGVMSFAADEFSTYTFVVTGDAPDEPGTPEKPGNQGGSDDSGSSSGSGSSGTGVSGQWIQDEVGWWYRYSDGTYPFATWKQLSYNNVTDWYHFNAAGYMDSGWYTDEHSDVFYLNPVSNGFKGAMQTGWRFIDQKWFYFNPVSDGRKGAMIKDTTVDGYYIDNTGVCKDKQ